MPLLLQSEVVQAAGLAHEPPQEEALAEAPAAIEDPQAQAWLLRADEGDEHRSRPAGHRRKRWEDSTCPRGCNRMKAQAGRSSTVRKHRAYTGVTRSPRRRRSAKRAPQPYPTLRSPAMSGWDRDSVMDSSIFR